MNFATVLNVLGNGEVLSPTRFAGAPSQRGPSPLLHTVKGEGAQELLRALCLGVVEEHLRRALLDDFAAVQEDDTIRNLSLIHIFGLRIVSKICRVAAAEFMLW